MLDGRKRSSARGLERGLRPAHQAWMQHAELGCLSVRGSGSNGEPFVVVVQFVGLTELEFRWVAETCCLVCGLICRRDRKFAGVQAFDFLARPVCDFDDRMSLVFADPQYQRGTALGAWSGRLGLWEPAPHDVPRLWSRKPARVRRDQKRRSLTFIRPGGCNRRISARCFVVSGPSSAS